MAYSAKLRRQGKRLGVILPKEGQRVEPKAPKLGVPTLTFGQGRITRFVDGPTAEGRYTVKMGRRPMGDFVTLAEAVSFAKWLGRKANRRAALGRRPKAEVVRNAHVDGVDAKGELSRMLGSVNGGAVTVR